MATAPDFTGDEAGARRWLSDNWRLTPWWCQRHYLPAIAWDGDGAEATRLLTELLPVLMPRRLVAMGTVEAKNEWLFSRGIRTPMCCRVGEEKLDEIWRLAGATQSSRR